MTFFVEKDLRKAFHYCKKIKSLLLGIDHRNAQVYLTSDSKKFSILKKGIGIKGDKIIGTS